MNHATASVSRKHLLVVDDDWEFRDLLRRYLSENGFEVTTANDGVEMARHLTDRSFDMIILDLMLPGEDGLTLTRQLRQECDTPLIMLSAKGDDVDRIIGIEMGADDYLPKPFNPRELLARIRSLLRRCRVTADPADDRYEFGHFRIDTTTRQLFKDGEPQELTASEFLLLKIFVENPRVVLTRDELTQRIRGYERQPHDRSIDVQVTRLRKKIELDPARPVFIRTIRGRGYMFTPGGRAG